MSASERLAALNEAMQNRGFTLPDDEREFVAHNARSTKAKWDYHNVLPEIVAVVRAAEREAPFEERGGNTGDLRRALAALDEKLEGFTKTVHTVSEQKP